MLSLHELTAAGLQIQEAMESSDNPQDWTVALEQLKGEIKEKAIGCGHVYRNTMAEADVFEAEANRLKEIADRKRRKAEHLRLYVEGGLTASGISEVKEGTVTIKFRKLPDVVVITDDSAIPAKFIKIVPESYAPIKDDIKKAIQAGEEVPGAKLETNRKKLEIK